MLRRKMFAGTETKITIFNINIMETKRGSFGIKLSEIMITNRDNLYYRCLNIAKVLPITLTLLSSFYILA